MGWRSANGFVTLADHPAGRVTALIDVATCASDASGYDKLFEIADKRRRHAGAAGEN